MQVHRLIVGDLECNCYILEIDNQVLVIDPGDDYETIRKYIGSKNVLGVLITHRHFDHVGALDFLLQDYPVMVYDYDHVLEKEYFIGPFCFSIILTAGHSRDSVTYYFKDDHMMFTGDFVFQGNIGRCDLPTGDFNEMQNSIEKIKQYDDFIILYPGHGEKTDLGNEKQYNPYFSA